MSTAPEALVDCSVTSETTPGQLTDKLKSPSNPIDTSSKGVVNFPSEGSGLPSLTTAKTEVVNSKDFLMEQLEAKTRKNPWHTFSHCTGSSPFLEGFQKLFSENQVMIKPNNYTLALALGLNTVVISQTQQYSYFLVTCKMKDVLPEVTNLSNFSSNHQPMHFELNLVFLDFKFFSLPRLRFVIMYNVSVVQCEYNASIIKIKSKLHVTMAIK